VRQHANRELGKTFQRLARCGYSGVELFDWHGLTAPEMDRALKATGLAVTAFHCDLAEGDAAESALDELARVGARIVVIPWCDPERLRTDSDVTRLAERLDRAAARAAARQMQLGYHNHWWEFRFEVAGRRVHDLLFERVDPSVFAEVDVYWAAVGGADPARVLTALGARARLIHLKDGPADGEESLMTAIGEGRLDIPAILRASRSAQAHVVEIDACAGDVFAALERSARTVRALWRAQAEEERP
jgi:sugar phosphate isomerase/epimerase